MQTIDVSLEDMEVSEETTHTQYEEEVKKT